jgi:hypothetical protein
MIIFHGKNAGWRAQCKLCWQSTNNPKLIQMLSRIIMSKILLAVFHHLQMGGNNCSKKNILLSPTGKFSRIADIWSVKSNGWNPNTNSWHFGGID